MIDRLVPGRRLRRLAFWLYAPLLFLGTHWPALKLPEGPRRPDLWVHMTIFGLWAGLLIAAGYFGKPLSTRNIAVVALVGVAYAAIDESTQAIPALKRTAAWDDYAFNCLGILMACSIALAIARVRSRASTSTNSR